MSDLVDRLRMRSINNAPINLEAADEIERLRSRLSSERYQIIRVRRDLIPEGAKLVEAYETEHEIIICGDPPPEPTGLTEKEYADWYETSHNCDALGCATLSHVIYRFVKQ